jgi:hypothetical protein
MSANPSIGTGIIVRIPPIATGIIVRIDRDKCQDSKEIAVRTKAPG